MQNYTKQERNADVFETKSWRIVTDIIAALSASRACTLRETEIKNSFLPNDKWVLDGQRKTKQLWQQKASKREFSMNTWVSARLKVQTAAAFSAGERGRCCCDQGWFRDHSGTPQPPSAPAGSLADTAPASVFRGWIWDSQRLSFAGKAAQAPETDAEKPELLFPRTRTESAPKGSQCTGNGLLLPGAQGQPLGSKFIQSCLCSCAPLPCTLHPEWCCWSRPGCLPCFHCPCISYHSWEKYDLASFKNPFLGSVVL